MSLSNKKRINAPITRLDRCPVHEKLRCHVIEAGRRVKLLWGFADDAGMPINLGVDNSGDSDSVSSSNSVEYPYTFELRIREVTNAMPSSNPVVAVSVSIDDAISGAVSSDYLPEVITNTPGIYQEEWGVYEAGYLIFSSKCFLFVNRGLFSSASNQNQLETGPPTLDEIRLSMRDHVTENQLLQNYEFDAAEIVQAIVRPLQYWNELPPPIQPLATTITFPFRELWLQGIQAYLLETAAHHYRRNHLPYSAGGVSVDDRQKDNPYTQAHMRLRAQFEKACQTKKIEINIGLFSEHVSSPYSRYFY